MKYLLREVGWVFNDSTYDNDGLYRNLALYATKSEAHARKKALEFEYFINRLDFIHRYESYGDYRQHFKDFKLRVANYLIEHYGLNPTLKLAGHRGYALSMFLQELTPEDVQEILTVMNIDFFSIIEVNETNQVQYEVQLNPIYLNGQEDYLWDDEGLNKLRFDTKLAAYQRFILNEYRFHHFSFNRQPRLKGQLSELSDMPGLLESLISANAGLKYTDGELTISDEIGAKLLLQLDELLNVPILLFEAVERVESPEEIDHDFRSIRNMNKADKEMLYEQSFRAIDDEGYKISKEYLLSYSFRLSMDQRFFNYRKIIEAFFSKRKELKVSEKYGSLYFNESMVQFHGVIKTLKIENGKNIVEGCFGYGIEPIVDVQKTGFGRHEDLEIAFEESLKNWLELHGDDYFNDFEQSG